MNELAAAILGYLIGATPTANIIARLRGIDLTKAGSGNPGTNNARQLGGYTLAASVLAVELLKGVAAVAIGSAIGGEVSALAAGVAAITGNIFSIWDCMKGGKGLAITGGVLLMAWPAGLAISVGVIAGLVAATRSSGKSSLGALGALFLSSLLWASRSWPNGWGIEDLSLLPYLAGGIVLLVAPKHLKDAYGVKGPSRPQL